MDGREVLDKMLMTANIINLPTVMIRKECYEHLRGFGSSLAYTFDYEYWMRIALYYDIAYIADPLIKWRIHSETLTNREILDSNRAPTITHWKEFYNAKRSILYENHDVIVNSYLLKNILKKEIAFKVTNLTQEILHDQGPDIKSLLFAFQIGSLFPEIYFTTEFLKLILKCTLPRSAVLLLKRVLAM